MQWFRIIFDVQCCSISFSVSLCIVRLTLIYLSYIFAFYRFAVLFRLILCVFSVFLSHAFVLYHTFIFSSSCTYMFPSRMVCYMTHKPISNTRFRIFFENTIKSTSKVQLYLILRLEKIFIWENYENVLF